MYSFLKDDLRLCFVIYPVLALIMVLILILGRGMGPGIV